MNVLEKQLTVTNHMGIHGRIATKMIKIANKYDVRLCIIYGNQQFDCSSVLDILSLALTQGATFTVRLAGRETKKAMRAVENLLYGTGGS